MFPYCCGPALAQDSAQPSMQLHTIPWHTHTVPIFQEREHCCPSTGSLCCLLCLRAHAFKVMTAAQDPKQPLAQRGDIGELKIDKIVNMKQFLMFLRELSWGLLKNTILRSTKTFQDRQFHSEKLYFLFFFCLGGGPHSSLPRFWLSPPPSPHPPGRGI
jgi:hypothetical protein